MSVIEGKNDVENIFACILGEHTGMKNELYQTNISQEAFHRAKFQHQVALANTYSKKLSSNKNCITIFPFDIYEQGRSNLEMRPKI